MMFNRMRNRQINEMIAQQAANHHLIMRLIVNNTESAVSKHLHHNRDISFLNKSNQQADSMVINSVNKTSNGLRMASEALKMETKKILTQEITLTSKAPLKILELFESTTNSGNIDDCLISECCKYLKKKGKELDNGPHNMALNHYFDTIRNLSRDTSVNPATRKKLLEVIELRARGWRTTEEIEDYYAKKRAAASAEIIKSRESQQKVTINLSTSTSSPALSVTNHNIINNNKQSSPESTESLVSSSSSSEDVIKHSGKFSRPVKVPGKNFLKDEFIIKNCDSGKVNPGAKDRLLQITGPNESSIHKAMYYIGDTIKRNASPIPCDQPPQPQTQHHHQGKPAPLEQSRQITSFSTPTVNKLLNDGQPNAAFVQTIKVGNEMLVISSSQPMLTKEAKNVLEEYFQKSQTTFSSYADSESDDSEVSAITIKSAESNGNNNSDQYRSGSNSGKSPSNNTHQGNTTIEKGYQKSASHGSLASSNSIFTKQISKDKPEDLVNGPRKIVYDREFLLKCANSKLSKVQPHAIKLFTKQIPDIARKQRQTRANSVGSAMA